MAALRVRAPGSARGSLPRSSTPPRMLEELEAYAPEGQFDDMFMDARETALRWVQKQRAELREESAALERDRRNFEAEMERLYAEFEEQREAERERIREDRRRARQELQDASRKAREDRRRAPELAGGGGSEGRMRLDWQLSLERQMHRRRVEDQAREARKISEHNAWSAAVVELNVGGTLFSVPRQTLALQPKSLFFRWFSGEANPPLDHSGRVYLDRDSAHFRTILNFLRDPEAPPATRDAVESEGLCREADFYGIRFFPTPLVYAIGGHDGSEFTASVELLDVEHRCWRSCRSLRAERAHFGAAAMRSRAQVFGGRSAEYQALCDSEHLDCLRGEWLPGADLFTPRRNCAGAGDGDRAFAVGGFDGEHLLSSVEVLDCRMKKWQQLRPMAIPRASASAIVLEGRLWVLGGTSGPERLRAVEAYDLRAGRWDHAAPAMCESRSAGQVGSCLGHLYAFGGIDDDHTVHRSLECFGRSAAGRWTVLRSMQEPRMDFGACGLGDMIMVSGGQHGEVLGSSEFYKPELDDWQFGPPMLTPRYGHHLVLMNV
uniref:BTB domain-containing protein n=1 Tax=Alexandrium monilatum TaxID=311494 RepID=A0A7S4UFK6_9DINO